MNKLGDQQEAQINTLLDALGASRSTLNIQVVAQWSFGVAASSREFERRRLMKKAVAVFGDAAASALEMK